VTSLALGLTTAYADGGETFVATAVAAGLLALPCATLEAVAVRRGVRPKVWLVALVFFALALAIGLAHAQAVFAAGARAAHAFGGGIDALTAERVRLLRFVPGDAGTYAGICHYHLESAPVAVLAMALTTSSLARAGALGAALPTAWSSLALSALRLSALTFVMATLSVAMLYSVAHGAYYPHHAALLVGGALVLGWSVVAFALVLVARVVANAIVRYMRGATSTS
jgi:hypothetical protein